MALAAVASLSYFFYLNRSQSDACILQLGYPEEMASLFPPLLDAV